MTYFLKLRTFGYMNPGPAPAPTPSPNGFDPKEPRFFWGRPACALIDYAKDQDWLKYGLGNYRRPDGAAQRFLDLYDKGEGFLKAALLPVIKKEAAYTACLSSMLQIKVIIAGFFEGRVNRLTERVTGFLSGLMPVYGVLFF